VSDDAGESRRRDNAAAAWAEITGEDPRRGTATMDLHDQRMFVGNIVRQLVDKGFSPYVVIEMLIAGAAFLGDNFGVSRALMAKAIVDVDVQPDRPSLILDPSARIGGG
jgi:hypothetical protein